MPSQCLKEATPAFFLTPVHWLFMITFPFRLTLYNVVKRVSGNNQRTIQVSIRYWSLREAHSSAGTSLFNNKGLIQVPVHHYSIKKGLIQVPVHHY
jgi:hypothetical protein